MTDAIRFMLLAAFVLLGAWWQVNELRYWRAVRRERPRPPFILRIVFRRPTARPSNVVRFPERNRAS